MLNFEPKTSRPVSRGVEAEDCQMLDVILHLLALYRAKEQAIFPVMALEITVFYCSHRTFPAKSLQQECMMSSKFRNS
jgi:hypothetical protein